MKLLIINFLIALLPLSAWAQGSIRGTLRDRSNNQPLGTGKLTLVNTQKKKAKKLEISPNDNGTFIFTSVEPGLYDLVYTNEGYVSQRVVGLFVKDRGEKLAYLKIRPSNPANPAAEEVINTYAALQAAKETKVQTASFDADKLIDAPATVFLLTQEDIREQGLTSLADIFNVIPNMEVQEKSSYYNHNIYTVRGLQSSKKFLILLNGVRISSYTFSYYILDKNIFIGNAKQIEILLGPASVLYGADAVTGVINIITEKGEQNKLQIRQATGRFDSQEYDVLGTYKGKKWSYAFNGAFYKSREAPLYEFYPQDYSWYNNRYSLTGDMPIGGDTNYITNKPVQELRTPRQAYSMHLHAQNDNLELGAAVHSQTHSFNTGAKDIFTLADKDVIFKQNTINLYGKHQYQKGKWRLQSQLSSQYGESAPQSNYTDAYGDFERVYIFAFETTAQLNEVLSYRIDSNNLLQAGINTAYTYTLPNTTLPMAQPIRRRGLAEQMANQTYLGSEAIWQDGRDTSIPRSYEFFSQFNAGAFIEHKSQLGRKLSINAGLRFDYVRMVSNKLSVNPRAGLVYKPNNNLTFKSFYGEAFLNPAIDLVATNYVIITPLLDSNGRATGYEIPYVGIGNLNTRPEKLRSFELSAAYSQNNFYLTANAYASKLIDIIILSPTNTQPDIYGIPVLYTEEGKNNGEALNYGGFVQAQYQFSAGRNEEWKFKLSADYSCSLGEVRDTNYSSPLKLPYNTAHTFKGSVMGKYKTLSLGLRGIYRGKTYYFGGVDDADNSLIYGEIPAFFNLNLTASYRIQNLKSAWYADLFLRINNLTDKRYYNVGYNFVDIMQLNPQDPLRWTIGACFTLAN